MFRRWVADSFLTLNPGRPGAVGNGAVIAAGTGLGEAGMFWNGQEMVPFGCEGGHTGFSPTDELGDRLLRFLRDRYETVSWERVLSGPGLADLYRFMLAEADQSEPEWFVEAQRRGDPAPAVSAAGLSGECEVGARTLSFFARLYGEEAGNLALKLMATGGVWVGGGIAPKILPLLEGGAFMDGFLAKGRMRPLLEAMPVHVVLDDRAALFGAARRAAVGLTPPACRRDARTTKSGHCGCRRDARTTKLPRMSSGCVKDARTQGLKTPSGTRRPKFKIQNSKLRSCFIPTHPVPSSDTGRGAYLASELASHLQCPVPEAEMDERRQHQRYDVKRPIKGSVKPRMEIRVVNISEGGLMVEAPFGLPPAGICELTLNLPTGEMVIKAKVARCRANMVKTATGGAAVVFHAGLVLRREARGEPGDQEADRYDVLARKPGRDDRTSDTPRGVGTSNVMSGSPESALQAGPTSRAARPLWSRGLFLSVGAA